MTAEERNGRIASFEAAHAVLVEALGRFPREMWRYRAAPDGWTIHEIVVHITDSEANSFVRCRRAIAEPGSGVYGYDETQWARALNYHAQSTEAALDLFRALRVSTHALIKDLPEPVWQQTIQHSESGTMTLDQWLDVYERHVREHIGQMEEVHAAWQASRK